jgi:hypothetical protein
MQNIDIVSFNNKNHSKSNKSQSVNSPILLISCILFIVLFNCYGVLFNSSSSVISDIKIKEVIDLIKSNGNEDDFKSKNTNYICKFINNIRIKKFYLFIITFIAISLVQLVGIYNIILGGDLSYSSHIYGIISACFFSTVLPTFIMLECVPYLVEIFENTVGYGIFSLIDPLLRIGSNIKNNLQIHIGGKLTNTDNGNFILTTLNMYNVIHVIHNLVKSSFNFSIVFDRLTEEEQNAKKEKDENYKTNEERLRYIYDIIVQKHGIGHFIWVYFACLISTFSLIKAIPNSYGGIHLAHM